MKPKRLISLLVAVCMMITMLPLSAVTAFAADTSTDPEATVGDYKYAYKVNADGTATITEFRGPVDSANQGSYDITIPTELDGYTVTGLGDYSFAHKQMNHSNSEVRLWNEHCHTIRSVTIPQSVKSIGYEAFCYCEWLQSLTFEGPIESMGDGAFEHCTSLTTFSLGGNIQKISDYAFEYCTKLANVTIPKSVTSIGDEAFARCYALKNVTIPDSVISIGNTAFWGCDSLTTLSLGENIKTIGDDAFGNCYDLTEVTIPKSVTSIGREAFKSCGLESLTISDAAIESMGYNAFAYCKKLKTLSLGENIKTIGKDAFYDCSALDNVTIPDSVTSIGSGAFMKCTSLTTLSLGKNIDTISDYAFSGCSSLSTITIPEKVTAIDWCTFKDCSRLKYIMLPAGLTSFEDRLENCPAGDTDGAIYYNNYKAAADALLNDNEHNMNIDADHALKNRKFLYLCKVTFDANGGSLIDKGGNLTDHAVVSVYKTEKINENDLAAIPNPTRAGYKFTGWYTADNQPLNVNEIINETITEDITFYAHWEPAPKAPVFRPLTVTGGIVTVKNGDKDVTDTLTVTTDETTGKKTYYVPDGATVTVTLDKNLIPKGNVFDSWSTDKFSLPQDQDHKAETITFPMNSDADIAAEYRDAATDHTPDTAVCHPLTVTGGIVTVKNGDKDVTNTLTVTTDETTGKKTYSVPDGATVTVTLDKTLIPEGMVFDIWSTGKFSLPLGQDYKAESITFTMNTMSSDADIAAQYRDATIEDDGPNVLGTAAIIGTAAVGTAVLGYQAYSLGAEFAGKLMALPYFPSNRSALAMMLWEDAGKPMPESELLYPDVGQEERDMDLQHAARWAMENELIPDLNDEGTAPEEMKFFPANPVSKLDVLNAWQKAQELKNN